MNAYLEHFSDAVWILGAILRDVCTEDAMGIRVGIALLIRLVIAQLLEDGLRHISVQVVNEDVLRHFSGCKFDWRPTHKSHLI